MTSINNNNQNIVETNLLTQSTSSINSSNNISNVSVDSGSSDGSNNPRVALLLELSRFKNAFNNNNNNNNSQLIIKPLLRQTSSAPSPSIIATSPISSPLSSASSLSSLSTSSSNNDSPVSSNPTSPQIMSNEFKMILNEAGTSSSFNNQIFTRLSEKIASNISEQLDLFNSKVCNDEDKSRLIVGKYVLVECPNETFNVAFHRDTNEKFFWRKFERSEHMKKLEPYLIMEGCSERIYKYVNVVNEPGENFVYVIYEQHHGDLHTYMKCKKRLSESEAKFIFKQCVEAVNDCHQNGIIVRDIKLKKFVFLNSERTKIGLTNLEDCLVLDEDAEDDMIKSQQGCPAYVSPEVLDPTHKSYSGRASDAWSLGIVLFTLLLGRYPFHHHTITTMFAKIARGKFQIPPSSGLSVDAKLLLRSLIRLKPDERLLPHETLAHNWLRQADTNYHTSLLLHQSEAKFTNTNFLSANNINQQLNYASVHKPLGISLSAPAARTNNSHLFNNPFLNNSNFSLSSSSSSSLLTSSSSVSQTTTSSLFPNLKRDQTSDRFVPIFNSQQQQQQQQRV